MGQQGVFKGIRGEQKGQRAGRGTEGDEFKDSRKARLWRGVWKNRIL